MSQHDFNIANQTASALRSDLNDALTALASLSSGATAPTTTYANMLWYDTANNILKMRNEADSGWANIGYLDQGVGAFRILDDTQVVNTSGTQTGLLGDQATATWEAGTGTTESLVSPAKVKAAIDALIPPTVDYTAGYQNLSLTSGTAYQNTKSTWVIVYYMLDYNVGMKGEVSANGSTWFQIHSNFAADGGYTLMVPPGHYYRLTSNGGINFAVQLG